MLLVSILIIKKQLDELGKISENNLSSLKFVCSSIRWGINQEINDDKKNHYGSHIKPINQLTLRLVINEENSNKQNQSSNNQNESTNNQNGGADTEDAESGDDNSKTIKRKTKSGKM